MKRLTWLLTILLVPGVVAWDDDAGDHEVGLVYATVSGEEQIQWSDASQFGWYPEADIVRAEISETRDHIIFEIQWSDAEANRQTEPQEFFRIRYIFEFTLRGQEMIGMFEHFMNDDFADFEYFIVGMKNEDSYNGMDATAAWPAKLIDGTTLRVEFPKMYFRDSQFIPIRQGDTLSDVSVNVMDDGFGFSSIPMPGCANVDPAGPGLNVRQCSWKVRDAVGSGNGLGNFEVKLAPEGVGHLMIRADRPWRLSNGLATTYLFEVEVHNFDKESDDVLLSAVDVPKGWQVQHPARIKFAEAGKEMVPIAVTVPFAHEHGRTDIFQLQAASKRDSSVEAGIFIGVIYADPAQPGGHHPTLFFHAQSEPFFSPWMNTQQQPEETEGDRSARSYEGAQAGPFGGIPTEATWSWGLRLQPSLQMGLDFELGRQGTAKFDLEFPSDISVKVTGSLDVFGQEAIHVMDLDGGEMDFVGGVTKGIELVGTPTPEADRIPFGSGNLYLTITAEATPTPEQSAQLLAKREAFLITEGGTLTLPLIDYHDTVDLSGITLNSFAITGNRSFAEVNPGKTIAFVYNVTNLLNEKQTITWSISGSNSEWATLVPAETLVPGGGQGKVVVAVLPPEGARNGETAELLLLGTSKQDADRQVFVRLTAYVNDRADIPDESHVAQQTAADVKKQNDSLKKDSPGFEIAAVIAGLLAIVVMLRRRE